jgi:putative transcriptional regulator
MPMTEKEILERDAKRDIGEELLQSVREMKAVKRGDVHQITVSPVTEARQKVGLSQAQFALLLGVSKRTLQDWEQGRRAPSGAAKSLLKVAEKRPEVLREIFG